MWFMMIVKNGKDCEAGKAVGEEVLQAIGKFNQDLKKAGALVELSRLHPSEKGARVIFSGGKHTVTDGPFAETKELIGGYWIIQVQSKQEAIEWAKRVPVYNSGGQEIAIELREILEVEDIAMSEAARRGGKTGKEFVKMKTQAG